MELYNCFSPQVTAADPATVAGPSAQVAQATCCLDATHELDPKCVGMCPPWPLPPGYKDSAGC